VIQNNKKNEKGFTLIEILIVLGIIAILFAIAVPLHVESLENQKEKRFFETLKYDFLFTQRISASGHKAVDIEFRNDEYLINKDVSPIIKRPYPEGWRIDKLNTSIVSFSLRGNIRQGSTLKVYTNNNEYNVIFPLGKGRFYIEKK